jgi:hypothetical protein
VLTECLVSSEWRLRTGISSFMNACKLKGMSRKESFRKYVLGQDSQGKEVDMSDYRLRGKMMGVVLSKRMEHSM